jgi:ubiquinone/menaquinone biosynthesis C-methylase UbiE
VSERQYFDTHVSGLGCEYAANRWRSTPLRIEQYEQTRETIERELGSRRLGTALEVGPGPCIWTGLLAGRATRLLAVDFSIAMLRQCATEHRARRCCGDAGALPVATDRIDSLCSFRAFEYFPDKARALKDFWRVLRPGGYLLIVTKNREYVATPSGDAEAIHRGNVTADEMITLVRDAGFTIDSIQPVIVGRTNIPFVWKWLRLCRRLIPLRSRRGLPKLLSRSVESFLVSARKPS